MKTRVVITGLGVVSPNGIGLASFTKALRNGLSGIRHVKEMQDLKFSCQIGGIPEISEEHKRNYFTELQLKGFKSSGILYGSIAAIDAWKDAGLPISDNIDFESGTIFGTGTSGVEKFREAIYKIDDKKVRRLGSKVVAQTMASGVSAYIGGLIGLGNQVTTNSSACTTGTEAILMGYDRIQAGKANRMLVGSSSDDGVYLWGGFDAMRVLSYKYNHHPQKGSRPMSDSACGFVPGSGAGALVLESLESALDRNAPIYAEILGGELNSGGQRNGGTMTAPNSEAVVRCISKAMGNCTVQPQEIDLINGHLTATKKDFLEVENWSKALALEGENFPYINSLKSMIGHCLAAAGSIESVASVLQLKEGFIFPNINCEDLNQKISGLVSEKKIPKKRIEKDINIVVKASFGFGDVNGCVIFKKYKI